MPPAKPKRASLMPKKGKQLPGAAATSGPATPATAAQGLHDGVDTALARRNQVLVPPRDMFNPYRLGAAAKEMHELLASRDPDGDMTGALYFLVKERIANVQYVADFQNEVRELIQGGLTLLAVKRHLPRQAVMTNLLAALIFYAPKEVVPLPVAAQIVAQEGIYTKMNPAIGDEISMRLVCHALGQVGPALHVAGMVDNPYYHHNPGNQEALLRGIGEGIKTGTLHVAGPSAYDHAIANMQKFTQGVGEAYEGLKDEMKKRRIAYYLDYYLGFVLNRVAGGKRK